MTRTDSRFPARPGVRLTILCGVRDRARRHSLAAEIVQRARRADLLGVTVFEALAGYGASGAVHTGHLMSDDAPLSIVVIDRPERVAAFLDRNADLLDQVLVAVEDVELIEV